VDGHSLIDNSPECERAVNVAQFFYHMPRFSDSIKLSRKEDTGNTLESFRRGMSRAETSISFDDKHGLVVDQGLVAALPEAVVLLDRIIQQGVANIPGRLPVVFSHHRFKLLARALVAAVVHSVSIENKNISGTHQRDLAEVGRVEVSLPQVDGIVFFAIRVIGGNLQAERKELHHAAFIDMHELSVLRREHQRRRMPKICESKLTARADFAVQHRRVISCAVVRRLAAVLDTDPADEGKMIWQTRVGKGGPLGGIEWGAAADDQNVYAALSDCDWKSSDKIKNGQKESVVDMDPDKGGGLFALRLSNGRRVWQTPTPVVCAGREHCSPAQLAAVTVIPAVVFSGSLDGHLRAYSSRTGKILWDFDTARDFSTVNGVLSHGGSLNGPGTVVVGGTLYVNSGYNRFGESPGNVLLAFSIDGK
jgi:hypothetical protein